MALKSSSFRQDPAWRREGEQSESVRKAE